MIDDALNMLLALDLNPYSMADAGFYFSEKAFFDLHVFQSSPVASARLSTTVAPPMTVLMAPLQEQLIHLRSLTKKPVVWGFDLCLEIDFSECISCIAILFTRYSIHTEAPAPK